MSGKKRRKDEPANREADELAEVPEPVEAAAPDVSEPGADQTVEEPEMAELRRRLAEKDELAKAYFAQLQRVQADFENYQKRVDLEMSRIADNACETIISGLLETLDNLERAVAHLDGLPGESAKGVLLVYEAMLAYLGENGLERIAAKGCQFDPRKHEAIMQAEEPGKPDGTILEEFQAGYSVKGKVVRPSKVKVCRAPACTAPADEISTEEKEE